MYRIMIVEDDATIAVAVAEHLDRYGFDAVRVGDFRRVEEEFVAAKPHLVILDINLPYQDGFHVCRAMRRHSSAPILFLSARTGDMEQVLGIESGGDDYVTKPFKLDILLAKVRALLRRAYGEYANSEEHPITQVGDLTLDLSAGKAGRGDATQVLTRNEIRLLALLMRRPGQIVSREECLEALWDDVSFVDDNTLTVNVTRLRGKLEQLGAKDALETRRGLGYVLDPKQLGGAGDRP